MDFVTEFNPDLYGRGRSGPREREHVPFISSRGMRTWNLDPIQSRTHCQVVRLPCHPHLRCEPRNRSSRLVECHSLQRDEVKHMDGQPKRVGIPACRDASGKKHDRYAVEANPRPFADPIYCGECTALVTAVAGYSRGSTNVLPLYRLRGHGQHDDDCQYDFDRRVGRLVRENAGLVARTGDEYRLRVEVKSLPDGSSWIAEKPGNPRSRIEFYRNTRRILSPSLKAAADIVRLLRSFADAPDAAQCFKATFEGRSIPWSQFCFEIPRDLERFRREVARSPSWPRVVIGRVGNVHEGSNGQTFITLENKNRGQDGGPMRAEGGVPIVVRLATKEAPTYARGDVVLAFGTWVRFTPDSGAKDYFTLWLDNYRRKMVATLG